MHDKAVYNHIKWLIKNNHNLVKEFYTKDGRLVKMMWFEDTVQIIPLAFHLEFKNSRI